MATRHNDPLKFKPNMDFRDLSKFDKITDSGIYFINDLYDVINTLSTEQESKPYEGSFDGSNIDYNIFETNYGGYYDKFKYLTISTKDELFNDKNVPNKLGVVSDEGKFLLGGNEFDNGDKPGFRFDTKGGYPSFLRGHGNGTTSYRGFINYLSKGGWGGASLNNIKADPFNFKKDSNKPAEKRGISIWKEFRDFTNSKGKNFGDGYLTTIGEDPFALLGILIVQGTDKFCIQKFINRDYIFYRYKRNGVWGNWKHNLPNVTEYVGNDYNKEEYDKGIRKDFSNINYPIGFSSTQKNKGYLFHSKDIIEYFEAIYNGTKPFSEADFMKLLEGRIKKSEVEDMIKKSGDVAEDLYAEDIAYAKKNEVYGRNTDAWVGEFNGTSKLAEGERLGVKYKVPDGLLNVLTYTHRKDAYNRDITMGDSNFNVLFYTPHLSGIMGRSTTARYLSGYMHEKPYIGYPNNKYDFDNTEDLGDAMSTISKKWIRFYKASPSEYIKEVKLPANTYEALVYTKVKRGNPHIPYEKLPHPIHLFFWETKYTDENPQIYFDRNYPSDYMRNIASLDTQSMIAQGADNLFGNFANFTKKERRAYDVYLLSVDHNPYNMKIEADTGHPMGLIYTEEGNVPIFEIFIDSIYIKKINNGNWR